MSTTQSREQNQDRERHRRETLFALIGEQVIHTLGKPNDLLQVQVNLLWEGHYRVNIFVGKDVAAARVAHSYFLVADGDGNVNASTPKITRKYDLEGPGKATPPEGPHDRLPAKNRADERTEHA